MNVPEAVGVPLIVIVFDAHVAETPAGNPFAPETPSFEIPVAPVVACVIFVNSVLIHKVGLELAVPIVLFGATLTNTTVDVLEQLPEITVLLNQVF